MWEGHVECRVDAIQLCCPPFSPKPTVQPRVLTDTEQDSSEQRTCKNKSNIAIPFSSLFPFFRLLFPNARYSL